MKRLKLGILCALVMLVTPSFAEIAISESQGLAILKGDGVKSNAAQSLFKSGVFSKSSFDNNAEAYRGYFFPQKSLTFFKHNIVALDVPYKTIHVGCCVMHENGFILSYKIGSDIDALNRFAKKNNCRIDNNPLDGVIDPIAVRLVKKWNTTNFTSVVCEKPNEE